MYGIFKFVGYFIFLNKNGVIDLCMAPWTICFEE